MGAGVIALVSVLSTLVSLATTFGIYKSEQLEQEGIYQKINSSKVSYSDVISFLSKIKSKAAGLSLNKRTKLANQLSQIGNSSYISSGLSEQLMGDLKTKLNNVATQMESLRSAGDVESSMADNSASAYSGLTDKEKSKAYKFVGDTKQLKQLVLERDKKSTSPDRKKEINDFIYDPKNGLMVYDQSTSAGRALAESESHAEKAKENYDKANALGEQYAK